MRSSVGGLFSLMNLDCSGTHDGKQRAHRHEDDVGDVVQLEHLHLRDALAAPLGNDGCRWCSQAGHDEEVLATIGLVDFALHVLDELLLPFDLVF